MLLASLLASIATTVSAVQAELGESKLSRVFAQCYPNTFETTIRHTSTNGLDETWVVTGDIPAMWLRDSAAQVWPYLREVKDDPKLRHVIRGVILRQFACIRLDPYANAFACGVESPWKTDYTEMKDGVYERKYELDSLCYPLRLAHGYWQATGDTTIFDVRWLETLDTILRVMREQQRLTGLRTSYRFQRTSHVASDTLINYGWGWPVKPCGLIASAFRPSDDATVYPFHVPSNFMAVDVLRKAAEILEAVNEDKDRATACQRLADEVNAALQRVAVVNHPEFGPVFAYEVDGFGNALMMDDANVPSLLSLPYLGVVAKDDPVYLNTRRLILSEANPFFFQGSAGRGIGSPHTGLDFIWPMSLIMQALTTTSDEEICVCLKQLLATDAGTCFIHEAFRKDDAKSFTRAWFAWANTLFGELVLTLMDEGKTDLLKELSAVDAVNVFMGTSGTGHTTPAACRPFGLVQAGPDTDILDWAHCSGYQFADTSLLGFSSTHLSGAGCGDLGDILLLPFTRPSLAPREKLPLDKSSECAEPGYYRVFLPTEGVDAEMTATAHVGSFRFTTKAKEPLKLLVDLQHGAVVFSTEGLTNRVEACSVERLPDLSGMDVALSIAGWTKRKLFAAIRFSRPAINEEILPITNSCERAPRTVFTFAPTTDSLQVNVALSIHSLKAARSNLATELPDWSFDATREAARVAWEDILSRIRVKGATEKRNLFYTSLYHLAVQPHVLTDVGQHENEYGELSLWDTYRAAHPLYTLLFPERVDGFVASLIAQSQRQGYLPVWSLQGEETDCMLGNGAVNVIADAYLKGFRGFDGEDAWEEIEKTLMKAHTNFCPQLVQRNGYFPCDEMTTESVSLTLEDAINCSAAARMASALGKPDRAAYYAARAKNYRHVFDGESGFCRGRLADGSWATPFDPFKIGHKYTCGGDFAEGNAWQYLWLVPHDVEGLIELLGGREQFLAKLDAFFALPEHPEGQAGLADVTGLIGQYAHGNEPSHHIAYLYALAGQPEKTQHLVRDICSRFYRPTPDGLIGNEDGGQMSAWYIWSAMGFYPVDPSSGKYVLGVPQFEEIELELTKGKTLKIVAKGLSDQSRVKSVKWNGQALAGPTIAHQSLVEGGVLEFELEEIK